MVKMYKTIRGELWEGMNCAVCGKQIGNSTLGLCKQCYKKL